MHKLHCFITTVLSHHFNSNYPQQRRTLSVFCFLAFSQLIGNSIKMVGTRRHPDGVGVESTPVARKSTGKVTTTPKGWLHTPSHLVLVWLTVSVPLVWWDATYMFLRPHSMPGGKYHSIWKPYSIYSTVDYVYGFPALESNDGFPAAQSALNVVENLLYMTYLYVVSAYGQENPSKQGRGAWSSSWWGRARVLNKRAAGSAVLLGFTGSLMTFSKTVLYGTPTFHTASHS
jgi:hypothetical protein